MKSFQYNSFRYIYPPRPQKFYLECIDTLKQKHLISQLKLNGTRTLIVIYPDRKIEFWTRRKTKQIQYKLTPSMKKSILSLFFKKGYFHLLDGELLHNKSKLIKDVVCLYDVLVLNGQYLYKSTYAERYNILKSKLGNPKKLSEYNLAYKVNNNIWLSKNEKDAKLIFDKYKNLQIVEGIVLKDLDGVLGYHFNTDRCNWMWKIRYVP